LSSVLAVALPVFAVIAAGLLAGRFRLASAADSDALNRFVFRFAMPAALFGLLSGAHGLNRNDALLALSYGGPAVAVLFGSYAIARLAFACDRPTAGAHAFASTIGNAVFLGLPIALAIGGWARPFVVLMLVEGIVVIGVGAALMSQPVGGDSAAGDRSRIADIFIRPLKNPLVAAALAGFALATLGVEPPGPARTFFDLFGRAAGPTALFSLGLFFATRPLPPIRRAAPNIATIAGMKMAVLPALALTLGGAIGVADPQYRGALALFTVTPVAVSAYVMASQYGRYVGEIAAAVATTTALSVLSISLVLIAFA